MDAMVIWIVYKTNKATQLYQFQKRCISKVQKQAMAWALKRGESSINIMERTQTTQIFAKIVIFE